MRVFDFLWEHFNWVIAFVSFCLAFNGILRKSITWSPPGPLAYVWPTSYLSAAQSSFFGYLYLLVGFVALASEFWGMVSFIVASLIAWIVGTFSRAR